MASNQLTKAATPRWLPLATAAAALGLGATASTLTGFNTTTFALYTGLTFITLGPISQGLIEGRRKGTDALARYLVYGTFLLALIPLISVLATVLVKGLPGLSADFLSTSMKGVTGVHDNAAAAGDSAVLGGIYHAIIGTLHITLLATLISVPVGLLTAIYLVEYGQGNWLSRAITFFVDVMTGIPSIVAGLFAAALFALTSGNPMTRTGLVAAVALSVLMVPTVVRSAEEMLRVVPNELREASYALGVRKWRTITKVVIPTAISGIASGVTLAIARVIGETAPILVTAGFITSINWNALSGWMATLPTYIYYQIMAPTSPTAAAISETRAWSAALVLILTVMALNLTARAVAKIFAPSTGR